MKLIYININRVPATKKKETLHIKQMIATDPKIRSLVNEPQPFNRA